MGKIHISADGQARPCSASTPATCPVSSRSFDDDNTGTKGLHFESQQAMEAFFSRSLASMGNGESVLDAVKRSADEYRRSYEENLSFADDNEKSEPEEIKQKEEQKSEEAPQGKLDENGNLRDELEDDTYRPVFTVNPDDMDKFDKKIKKANERLAKNGIEDRFTYDVTYEERREEVPPGSGMYVHHQYAIVELNKPVIAIKGNTFLASVTQEEGGMLVRGTKESDLDGWRPESMSCDHCGHNRGRKKVYIIQDKEGQRKQVGSSCVAEYMGVRPEGLWALDVDRETFNAPDNTPKFKPMYEPKNIALVSMALSSDGHDYLGSQSMNPTSEEVRNYFNPPTPMGTEAQKFRMRQENEERERRVAEYASNPENLKKVEEAVAAVEKMNRSDYGENMKTIFRSSTVSGKSFNYAVSVAAVYNRAKKDESKRKQWDQEKADREAKRAEQNSQYASGFLGNEGDSVKGTSATFMGMRGTGMTDFYGDPVQAITLKSADNKQVVWFTSKPEYEFKEGDEIEITSGSIKRHGNYQGVDQTIITRAKIVDKHVLNTSAGVKDALKKAKFTKNFKSGRGQDGRDWVALSGTDEDGGAMVFSKDKKTGKFSVYRSHRGSYSDKLFEGTEQEGHEFLKYHVKNTKSALDIPVIEDKQDG